MKTKIDRLVISDANKKLIIGLIAGGQKTQCTVLSTEFIQEFLDQRNAEGWRLISVIPLTFTLKIADGGANVVIGYDYYWQK
ncbi:MAG: hypothetical protein ACFFBD_12390 [Candidatus Hodarchaeota archaeon]